jgi:hypothetical protein
MTEEIGTAQICCSVSDDRKGPPLAMITRICTVHDATWRRFPQVLPLHLDVTSLAQGRAIAQAISRRLPTAEARVQPRVWTCGIL